MIRRRKQRLMFVALLVVAFGSATALILYSFEQNLLYFYTPSQVTENNPIRRDFNIGGIVVVGSVQYEGTRVQFDITDTMNTISIDYKGLLPDLFHEGQGIIATGTMNDARVFVAKRVLAKHDENYMPPEVAEALRQTGTPMQPIGIKRTP